MAEIVYSDQEIFDMLEAYGTDDYGMVRDLGMHTEAMLIYDRWADYLTGYPSFEDFEDIYIKAANEFLEEWPLFREIVGVSQVLDFTTTEDEFIWTFEVA